MTRLLNANFARLFRSKLFWICAAASVALGLIEVIPKAKNLIGMGYPINPEQYLISPGNFMSWAIMLIITAIFVGIFVGAEHGGVLRNKIIAGQRRGSVYMANLLTCISGVLIFQILFVATVLLTGIIMGGEFILSFETIAVYELLQFVSLIGICALFTAIAMLIPQKLAGAIAALVLVVGFYIIDICVDGALYPLLEEDYVLDEDTGKITMIERTDYTDEERLQLNVLTFLKNTNPLGQDSIIRRNYGDTYFNTLYRLSGHADREIPPVPTEVIPYSLGMIAASAAVGILVFRKKDLR